MRMLKDAAAINNDRSLNQNLYNVYSVETTMLKNDFFPSDCFEVTQSGQGQMFCAQKSVVSSSGLIWRVTESECSEMQLYCHVSSRR